MEVLYSEDGSYLKSHSPASRYKGYISEYRAGEYIPIQFDYLDYIECIGCAGGNKYRAVSHPVIVEFYTEPDPGDEEIVEGDPADKMEILFDNDETRVKRFSSIDQYNKFIATYERGGWTPIEFDYLDYIECVGCSGKDQLRPVTHPVIIEFDDKIGYHFPIGECNITTDDYLMADKQEVELLPLPEFYGDGFYESYADTQVITNFDDGNALGIRNDMRLKIGQDYVLASEFLPSDDPE